MGGAGTRSEQVAYIVDTTGRTVFSRLYEDAVRRIEYGSKLRQQLPTSDDGFDDRYTPDEFPFRVQAFTSPLERAHSEPCLSLDSPGRLRNVRAMLRLNAWSLSKGMAEPLLTSLNQSRRVRHRRKLNGRRFVARPECRLGVARIPSPIFFAEGGRASSPIDSDGLEGAASAPTASPPSTGSRPNSAAQASVRSRLLASRLAGLATEIEQSGSRVSWGATSTAASSSLQKGTVKAAAQRPPPLLPTSPADDTLLDRSSPAESLPSPIFIPCVIPSNEERTTPLTPQPPPEAAPVVYAVLPGRRPKTAIAAAKRKGAVIRRAST